MLRVRRGTRVEVRALLAATALVAVLAALIPSAASAAVVQRLEGDDTVSAALAWSQFAYPDGGVTTALLGRADDFPDALSAGGPQGQAETGAPLLLTPTDALDPAVAAELERLGVTDVVILGGVNAISADVEAALTEAGYTVTRLEGPERIATAVAVAEATYPQATAAVLARAQADAEDPSRAFADSLAAGALAASLQAPVLLTPTGELDADVLAYLTEAGVETVYVIGGELAISADVEAALTEAGFTVQRVGGDNRAATAVAVAMTQFTQGPPNAVALIEGSGPDAWASGLPAAAASATQGIALLLTAGETLPPETEGTLAQLGGAPVVCGPLVDPAACDAADAPPPEPPGTVVTEGLAGPRDVEIGPDGEVYVTIQNFGGEDCIDSPDGELCFGETSQVVSVDTESGETTPVVDGLSSLSFGVGASDVAVDAEGTFHIAMGLGAPPEAREGFPESGAQLGTYVQSSEGETTVVADIAGHEGEDDPDGAGADSNPYAIALATDGGVVIADAGGNSLVRVDEEGAITTLATFPEVETEEGPRQAVPTSIAVGPDGDYYVGELGGEQPGAARIWRVPAEGGEPEVYAEGLTFVIDLAFDGEGNLYVLSLFPTGVLTRISPDGEQVVLSEGDLVEPLGLAVAEDGLYVVNCGLSCPDGGQLLFVSFDELAEMFAGATLDRGEPEGYTSPVHEAWGDRIGPR
ncbi:ScyD/ScyE family protein [Euzebya sp.]|uniref:ScyD/ScyE family protein n=1 Tax=Euzebya sp. TaxID=1971409 RepID=UPI0035155B75